MVRQTSSTSFILRRRTLPTFISFRRLRRTHVVLGAANSAQPATSSTENVCRSAEIGGDVEFFVRWLLSVTPVWKDNMLRGPGSLRVAEATEPLGTSPNTVRVWASCGKILGNRRSADRYRPHRREEVERASRGLVRRSWRRSLGGSLGECCHAP